MKKVMAVSNKRLQKSFETIFEIIHSNEEFSKDTPHNLNMLIGRNERSYSNLLPEEDRNTTPNFCYINATNPEVFFSNSYIKNNNVFSGFLPERNHFTQSGRSRSIYSNNICAFLYSQSKAMRKAFFNYEEHLFTGESSALTYTESNSKIITLILNLVFGVILGRRKKNIEFTMDSFSMSILNQYLVTKQTPGFYHRSIDSVILPVGYSYCILPDKFELNYNNFIFSQKDCLMLGEELYIAGGFRTKNKENILIDEFKEEDYQIYVSNSLFLVPHFKNILPSIISFYFKIINEVFEKEIKIIDHDKLQKMFKKSNPCNSQPLLKIAERLNEF